MSPLTKLRGGRLFTTRPQKIDPPVRDAGGRKILVLNYEYPPVGGGASPVTQAVCRELARRGNHVDVVTMGFRGLPAYEEEPNLRIFRIPCLRSDRHVCRRHELLTWVISAYLHALPLAKSMEYDIVHAHFFLPCGFVAREIRRWTGIPYVITAYGSDVAGFGPGRFRLGRFLLAPLWRRIVRDAADVTSASRSLAERLRASYRREVRVRVIPNGIDPTWIQPTGKSRSILLVCRLSESKGVQYLLEALRGTSLGHEVHVVGEGPYRSRLESLAREVGVPVMFHGRLGHESRALAELYRHASIFVFPSAVESFPASLLEAMLAGTAIVAVESESCREVLGDAACWVPAGAVDEIRDQLVRLAGDDSAARLLGEDARQRVLEHFTWERVGRRYHDLFVSLTSS